MKDLKGTSPIHDQLLKQAATRPTTTPETKGRPQTKNSSFYDQSVLDQFMMKTGRVDSILDKKSTLLLKSHKRSERAKFQAGEVRSGSDLETSPQQPNISITDYEPINEHDTSRDVPVPKAEQDGQIVSKTQIAEDKFITIRRA